MNWVQLQRTAQFILDAEARRDKAGHLVVYPLPQGDGGGRFEIAGINERFDHDICWELRRLIEAKQFEAAEKMALEYYMANTARVADWYAPPAIEAWLRDAAFNRGLGGAAKMLQMALGVTVDGGVGQKTRAALKSADAAELLERLHTCQEVYERRVAPPVGERAKFWKGLNNRWNARLAFCKTLLEEKA